MCAIVPLHLALAKQLQIGFVHERGRLQRMARALTTHAGRSQSTQLIVNERSQFIGSLRVAAAELVQ
jgi:hypothetical protein